MSLLEAKSRNTGELEPLLRLRVIDLVNIGTSDERSDEELKARNISRNHMETSDGNYVYRRIFYKDESVAKLGEGVWAVVAHYQLDNATGITTNVALKVFDGDYIKSYSVDATQSETALEKAIGFFAKIGLGTAPQAHS